MMKRLTYVLLVAAGCEKEDPLFCEKNPTATGCTTPMDDAAVDLDGDLDMFVAVDAQQIFGEGAYTISLMTPPVGELPLTGDFNTDTNTSCLSVQPTDWDAAQEDACIVVANNITTTDLNVLGTRPLVLLARTTLTINGKIDLASRRLPGPKAGPGAGHPSCGTVGAPGTSVNGAGGGAGGTFTTKGGNGGNGQSTNGTPALSVSSATPTILRGGCNGGNGGMGDGNPGLGALGGGAGFLVAGVSIVFADGAYINASGAGATQSDESAGGGGGGSGGMIVLYAPTITAGSNVNIVANGGGGSGGADNSNNGGNPQPGGDPNPTNPAMAALGGTGGTGSGVSGGNGSSLGNPGNDGSNNSASGGGGGGGGGGAGFIQTNVTIANVSASPTPAPFP